MLISSTLAASPLSAAESQPKAACAGKAYVVNSSSASVSVIDLAARRVVTTIAVGEGPSTVVICGAR